MKANEFDRDIEVRGLDGQRAALRMLDPDRAEQTLGVRAAPDGNWDAQTKWLRQQAVDWATHQEAGHLPRGMVWQAFQTTLLPRLSYALPATHLSKQQCEEVLKKCMKKFLPKAGIAWTVPVVLHHAPATLTGFGIPNLYI